jgi:NAD-dependent deacetylase
LISPPVFQSTSSIGCVARRVVVLTGAGISAESGVRTFRDALSGLWARFRPKELATPQALATASPA